MRSILTSLAAIPAHFYCFFQHIAGRFCAQERKTSRALSTKQAYLLQASPPARACFSRKAGMTACMIVFFALMGCIFSVHADAPSIPLLVQSTQDGQTTYSMSIKILLFMSLLTLLPALLMTMTSFTRVIIVLAILRQAIGIPNVPGNQILIGLSLIITFYVMMPVLSSVQEHSLTPYMNGRMQEEQALTTASKDLKKFMLKQTRKADLQLFIKLSKQTTQSDDYPFYILLPAFITSELKTAFQIGFLIFLPFLIIDLVTASVLMSMGMMMLSPMIISLPFKILFFVMLNGWPLMIGSLISSFR